MTLIMTIVNDWGIWAATDHRLTELPSRRPITKPSVKHVIVQCNDGSALISYTGLGRFRDIDISEWIRRVLRGESRTLDGVLTDLRLQATAAFGRDAMAYNVPHIFFVGAFLQGRPWTVEIKNVVPQSAFSEGGIREVFDTVGIAVEHGACLAIGGAGSDSVSMKDRQLLSKVSKIKPRRPADLMKLMAQVNMHASDSGRPGSESMSKTSTVVYMPPNNPGGIMATNYGPSLEAADLETSSHLFLGLDLDQMTRGMRDYLDAFITGRISEEEFDRKNVEAAKRSMRPMHRRSVAK